MPSDSVMLKRELFRFLIVGTTAAAVHFLVVFILVQQYAIQPLSANVAAFVTAFQVSYWGHRNWTFSHAVTVHRQSLPRGIAIGLLAFLCNESLYFILLRYTALPYWFSLGLVLVLVAGMTFFLSKLWAFAHMHTDTPD